ncbi:MAG: hypothetical protein QOF31_5659 [Mycobacterium sp.]|jgi:hypothetical protein|nr:hypothetical protein [Mycobacterium sp.]
MEAWHRSDPGASLLDFGYLEEERKFNLTNKT